MATLNDGVMVKLAAYAPNGTSNDKIRAWLALSTVPQPTNPALSLSDLWVGYLDSIGGFSGGSLQERISRFMNAAPGMPVGLTNYNDIQTAYWNLP